MQNMNESAQNILRISHASLYSCIDPLGHVSRRKCTSCKLYISNGTFNIHFWLVYAASAVMVHVFFVSFKNRLWDDPSRVWIHTIPYKLSCFPKNPQYLQCRLCRKARSADLPNPTVSFAKFVKAA